MSRRTSARYSLSVTITTAHPLSPNERERLRHKFPEAIVEAFEHDEAAVTRCTRPEIAAVGSRAAFDPEAPLQRANASRSRLRSLALHKARRGEP